MNEKEIKMLYEESVQNSAPDMEKIWSRIESRLDEVQEDKTDAASENAGRITAAKKKNSAARLIAWAAAFAVAAGIGVMALSRKAPLEKDNSIGGRAETAEGSDAAMPDELTGGAAVAGDEAPAEENESPRSENYGAKNESNDSSFGGCEAYEELDLAHGEIKTADYTPRGDDFFVEQAVLSQTKYFVDCRITSADAGEEYCIYEAEIIARYSKEGYIDGEGESFTLISSSPLLMSVGGEYLLPVTEEQGETRIVFEGAPQIEYTEDGRVVFHSGWNSLLNGSEPIRYPANRYDIYYYDRMRIASSDNVMTLLGRWQAL